MTELIDDLLAGKDLKVILYPDQRRENQPDIECYDLSHVVIDGDRFWGAFRSVHSSSGLLQMANEQAQVENEQTAANLGIREVIPSAYAYSNYYRFCINYSYLQDVSRIYEDVAYSKIRFATTGEFEEVWRGGGELDIARLHDKVEQGKRFKIIVRDKEGFTRIHPVHTPEVYVDQNLFIFDTESDALPNVLFSREALDATQEATVMSLNRPDRLNADGTLKEGYFSSPVKTGPHFVSSKYMVNAGGEVSQWDLSRGAFVDIFVDSASVWAEV